MLTREQLDDLVVDYMYDELTAQDREAVEAALLQHPDLAEEVAAHRETRSLMAKMPMLDPPQPMLDTVMRAARHAAAPEEPKVGVWQRVLGLFAQPAFATFAVVVGVAVTAVFAMGGDADKDAATPGTSGPMVAQVNRMESPATSKTAAPEAPATGISVASADPAPKPEDKAAAESEKTVASSTTPLPVKDIAPAVAAAASARKAPMVAAARSAKAKARKKTRAPVKSDRVIAKASAVADDGGAGAEPIQVAGVKTAAEGIRVAEASAPTQASLNSKPAAPPTATTHPGMGAAPKTPANAGTRLTKQFQALVKAGNLTEAAKVLAQLRKLPTTSKATATALSKTLAAAEKAAKPAAKP